MPTYVYQCSECERSTELIRSVEDRNSPATCECGCTASRDFSQENITVSVPNTLGSLADKHSSQFSKEYKQHLKMKARGKTVDGKQIKN